jgi:hypothetical protein
MIDTPCKDCCFAQYDLDNFTQIGCSLNILDKFRERGSEVLECYDEDKAFYVIKGRICPYKRSAEWVKKHSDENDIKSVIKNGTHYSFGGTIFLEDSDETKLERTLDSLRNMDRKFTNVHVFRKTNNVIHPDRIRAMLKGVSDKWKIHNVISDMNQDKLVMQAIKGSKDTFVTLIKCGNLVDPMLVTKTREFILDELMQFAMIVDGNDNCLISSTVFAHFYYNGDSKIRVHEGIEKESTCEKKIVYKMWNGQIF